MKNIFFTDLSNFLFKNKHNNLNSASYYLGYSILFYFIAVVIVAISLKGIDNLIALPVHKIHTSFKGKSIVNIILLGLIIAPIMEELCFRLFLKYTRLNVCISGIMFSYYLITIFLNEKLYQIDIAFYRRAGFVLLIGVFIYLFQKLLDKWELSQNFWKNNFKLMLYISIFSFSLIHIKNLTFNNYQEYFLIPLLIFPQFLLAIFNSFLRCNFGIKYSIVFHSIANFLPVLGGIISISQ